MSSDPPTDIGPPGFASRPVTAADEAVLLALFGAVRAGELHLDGWEPALRDQMLRTQFDAQRRGYREEFPAASERLILHSGAAAGASGFGDARVVRVTIP